MKEWHKIQAGAQAPQDRKGVNMKEYIIIDLSTDKTLGTVQATDITSAEYKACGIWSTVDSNYIAAFSKESM